MVVTTIVDPTRSVDNGCCLHHSVLHLSPLYYKPVIDKVALLLSQ